VRGHAKVLSVEGSRAAGAALLVSRWGYRITYRTVTNRGSGFKAGNLRLCSCRNRFGAPDGIIVPLLRRARAVRAKVVAEGARTPVHAAR